MTKRRGPSGRRLEPNDLLAGRARPTISELLDLIHRVNPTGHELAPREAELRYSQKSRLQSLLVRTFQEEIAVVPDPEREGTVSLLHRGHGRDGCHAVIAELEDDARAWVQLQVDLGAHETEAPRAPAARPSGRGQAAPDDEEENVDTPDALVRRAERALEAYDYEAARAALGRATAASGGAAGPAAALLALLVETLGDDAAALEHAASLGRAALADPRVRALLALVAARAGDEARALAFLRGAGDARTAEVLAVLAGAALARGDTEGAATLLSQLKTHDPAHPLITGLATEIARARAAARGPAEAELGRLVEAGPVDEAERKANEVLARWPESEAARRVLRTIEERRRRNEALRLAADAEAARGKGETEVALALLGQALLAAGRGAERQAIELRLAAVEAEARARDEAARVAHVGRLLESLDPTEGLSAYLELDAALRQRAREQSPREELRWLELCVAGRDRANVAAVIALGRARAAGASDPEATLGLLEAHLGALERVPEARRLVEEAASHLRERRAARAREEAESAALRALAAAAAEREARVAELRRLRAGGHLFEARDVAEELAQGEERERWEQERRAIQGEIQAWFLVEVDEDPEPLTEQPLLLWFLDLEETVRALTADGDTLVLVQRHQRWVFVRVLDWKTEAVLTTVLLRTPEPLRTIRIEVRGPRLWITGSAVVELSLETWEILSWRGAADLASPHDPARDVLLAAPEDPAALRFLWVLSGQSPGKVRVLDVDRRRIAREVPDTADLMPVPGIEDPRVVCCKAGAMTVHEARGAPVPGGRIALNKIIRAMAPRPDGRGLVALASVTLRDPDGPLEWIEISPDGVASPPVPLEGSDGRRQGGIGVSHEAGMMFVILFNTEGTQELLALRVDDDQVEQVWRAQVPNYTLMMQDAAGRRIVAIHAHAKGLYAVQLGPEPPELPDLSTSEVASPLWFPTPATAVSCERPFGDRIPVTRKLVESVLDQPRLRRSQDLQRRMRAEAVDPQELIELVIAFEQVGPYEKAEARRIRAWLDERWPRYTGTRLLHAGALARSARWSEVLSALEGLTAENIAFDSGRKRHLYHLLALASLHVGDLERARDMLVAAADHEGHCQLERLGEIVDLLLDPPAEWDASVASVTGFIHMQGAADTCLAAGDARGALDALSGAKSVDELQVLARRAEAYLQLEPEGRHDRLRKLLTLARLLQADEKDPVERTSFPLGGATWDAGKIADVVGRARAWLDALGARW